MNTTTQARDPVCGMTVVVHQDTASATIGEQIVYFCAPGCRAAFLETPERFARTPKPTRGSSMKQLLRETSIVVIVLALAVTVVALARGKKEEPPPVTAGSAVTGTTAGQDQVVDNGANSVIVSATFERAASTDREAVFTVSLNTHSIDLTTFDPAAQMQLLTASGQASDVETAVSNGERSSHHQNYRVTFARPADSNVTLVVQNVSSIAERRLSFQL